MYIKYILALILLLGILYFNSHRETFEIMGDLRKMREQKEIVDLLYNKGKLSLNDRIQMAAYDANTLADDKTIYSNQKDTIYRASGDYALNDIVEDIMNGTSNIPINWENVYVDQQNQGTGGDQGAVLTLMIKQNSSGQSSDEKSILHTTPDMCTKYKNNQVKINENCKLLSNSKCKSTDCCVLLNGKQCVAGDANGALYLTDDEGKIDQRYYHHKNICYGNCNLAQKYEQTCGNYMPNSTGISKDCMIKMFNNYGCPNKNPIDLINDTMVKSYSQTTKQYVENYIKTAVKEIKSKNDNESKAMCKGS